MTQQDAIFFSLSQERQTKFSCDFISSRGVSRIQYNVKFWACLFNLRNCKNDDRWHMELTYVLYSLLKKGVQRNFDKGRSYSIGRSLLKLPRVRTCRLSLHPTHTVVGGHQ